MLRGLGKPVGRFVSSPAVCRASALRRGVRTRSRRAAVVHAGDWRSEAAEVAAERAATPSKAATAGRGFKPFGAPRRAPLSIVPYPSPVLRAANKDVTVFDAALNLLTRDMFAIMYKTDGVGLAAPQVGVNVRLMVFNEAGTPDDGAETVLCNPRLVEASPEEELFEEGCLSFPNIYADVMRPLAVTVAFQDVTGAEKRMSLSGLPARIFQHEFDHLQGVLFHDRMSAAVLATVRPQLDVLERDWARRQGSQRATA